jgi:TRAP-type mannitol/chloroaromatic compound transport system permease small subunit
MRQSGANPQGVHPYHEKSGQTLSLLIAHGSFPHLLILPVPDYSGTGYPDPRLYGDFFRLRAEKDLQLFARCRVFKALVTFTRYVDAINRLVGRFSMYLMFGMMFILLYASFSRTVLNSAVVWAVELAQFFMAAYYLLGGGYSIILHGHVRMDVLYSKWSPKKRALADSLTAVVLLFYMVVLLYGSISSTAYSIQYNQHNYSAWAPPLWPIKIIMVIGIFLMLLQCISRFIKDVCMAKGLDVRKIFGDYLS